MAEDTPQTPTHDQPREPAPETNNEEAADTAAKTAAESINITFVDSNGGDVSFKLKRSTKLGKAMNAYSARSQKDLHTMRFLFDGERLTADDTADSLSMEDGDKIEVHMEQIGGAPDHLTITFVDNFGSKVHFKLSSTTRLGKAMNAFSALKQKKLTELSFRYDNVLLKSSDTAETLCIPDGDQIDVYMDPTDPIHTASAQDVTLTSTAAGTASGHIMLQFCDDESKHVFQLKPTCKMGRVMDLYTSLLRHDQLVHGFFFKGRELKAEDTAEKLSMVERDMVEVHTTVTGSEQATTAEGEEKWLIVNHAEDDPCEDSEDDMPAKMATLALRNIPKSDGELAPADPTITKPASDRMILAFQHCTGAHAISRYKISTSSRLTKALRRHAAAIGIPFEELDLSLNGVYVDHNTVASTFATRKHLPVFVTSLRAH